MNLKGNPRFSPPSFRGGGKICGALIPDEQAVIVSRLLEVLDVQDAPLMAHDWGGPIGLSAMLSTGRISSLYLGNSWAWPVNGDIHFEWFSKLFGGRGDRFAADRFAVLINGIMPMAMRRRKLTRAAAHWLRIFPGAAVTRLPNCGHYLWEDAPEECTAAVRRWMDRGAPATH